MRDDDPIITIRFSDERKVRGFDRTFLHPTMDPELAPYLSAAEWEDYSDKINSRLSKGHLAQEKLVERMNFAMKAVMYSTVLMVVFLLIGVVLDDVDIVIVPTLVWLAFVVVGVVVLFSSQVKIVKEINASMQYMNTENPFPDRFSRIDFVAAIPHTDIRRQGKTYSAMVFTPIDAPAIPSAPAKEEDEKAPLVNAPPPYNYL